MIKYQDGKLMVYEIVWNARQGPSRDKTPTSELAQIRKENQT